MARKRLAHERRGTRAGHHHGDAGAGQALEHAAGAGHLRDLVLVVIRHDALDVGIELLGAAAHAKLGVEVLARVGDGHGLDFVDDLARGLEPIRAKQLVEHVVPHGHGIEQRAVTVEDGTGDL